MRNLSIFLLAVFVFTGIGCAQVQVKAPKDPIKVDITMRLDVYQHVKQDIDDIENIVSGKPAQGPGDEMHLNFLFTNAYAEEGLPQDVEQAAVRRRDRKNELSSWESRGAIGENAMGLVEARSSQAPAGLISAENSDRMLIYRELSKKNGAALENVQKMYAQRLQADAPSGTPMEVLDQSGKTSWKTK